MNLAAAILLLLASGIIGRALFTDRPIIEYTGDDEPVEAKRTWEWQDDSGQIDTITVVTIRGVGGPGETVSADESLADWKARHLARVAAAQQVFPPITGD